MSCPQQALPAEAIDPTNLPKSHRVHWSRSRKALVVKAIENDVITFQEARDRYLLSRSEFEQWKRETGRTLNQGPSFAGA